VRRRSIQRHAFARRNREFIPVLVFVPGPTIAEPPKVARPKDHSNNPKLH